MDRGAWWATFHGVAETNPEGFKKTSLVENAKNLKGHLLICQGAIDDTVVWEHSLSFIQRCIDLEIPVDYFPYPVARHNREAVPHHKCVHACSVMSDSL